MTGGAGVGPSRLYVGAGGNGAVLAGAEQALLVLGPPRSGKSSAVVVPNVLGAPGPVVATSTKPDLLDATLAARRARGRCGVFDPTGTTPLPGGVERLCWSPVAGAGDWDRAVLAAAAMVGAARPDPGPQEAHWTERAGALLAPLLHAAARAGLPMREVVSWVNRRDCRMAMSELAAAGATLALDTLTGVERCDDRELSGIWSTASGVLAAYRSEAALAAADRPDFDAGAFVRSSDTVYVCASGARQAAVGTLVAGLLSEVTEARYDLHATGAAAAPLLLALDEAANVAPLPDLPRVVSEGGGQGVVTLACFQDLSQARHRWGARADGFLTLFGTKLLLPGVADLRTLEAVSALAGDVDVRVASRTAPRPRWVRRGATTVTRSVRRQRALPVDALRRGRPGAGLLLEGAAPPAWVTLTPWFASEAWRRVAGPVPPHRAVTAGRDAPQRDGPGRSAGQHRAVGARDPLEPPLR